MRIIKNQLIPIAISSLMLNVALASAETLEQAWKQAIENNHRIKSVKAQTSVSEQQLYSAQGQRLPDLNISGGYTQLSETPAIKTQVAGQPAQFSIIQPGSGNAQAVISLPVFTSGRISHNISAAEATLLAAQHNEVTSILNIKMLDLYISVT